MSSIFYIIFQIDAFLGIWISLRKLYIQYFKPLQIGHTTYLCGVLNSTRCILFVLFAYICTAKTKI